MVTRTAPGRAAADAAWDWTRAVTAGTSHAAAAADREAAIEAEQAVTEAWRFADPEGAARLDAEMKAAETVYGDADVFAAARHQAAREQAARELAADLELEAG